VESGGSMSSGLFSEALTPQSILLADVSGYSVGPVFVDKVLRSAVPTEDRSKILILETELRASNLNWIPVLYAHNKDEDYLCAVRSLWRDVKAWNEDGSAVSDSQHLEKLLKDVENYAADDSKTIVFVNLTSLLLSFSLAKISRLLVAVTNTFNVRLSVFQVHSDCHPPATVDGLKKLVDASVEVSKPNYDGQNGAKVHLTAYKTKGRNSYVHKYYRIDSHFQFLPLTSEAYWGREKAVNPKTVVSDAADEAAALESTFSLGLSLAEKEAKNKVQMPFWRQEQRSKASSGGGGKVFYVADQVDDCDEEDPDDEVNI